LWEWRSRTSSRLPSSSRPPHTSLNGRTDIETSAQAAGH
jgi:hypothetical protein